MNLEKGRVRSFNVYGPIRGCSSAGRAPALQAGGHRFDPVHLHQLSEESKSVVKGKSDTPKKSYGLIAQVVRAHA